MLVFDLKKGKTWDLPSVDKWFNPYNAFNIVQIGNKSNLDNDSKKPAKSTMKSTTKSNLDELTQYVYILDDFYKLKDKLNKSKSRLDKLSLNEQKVYRLVSNVLLPYKNLQGDNGIIVKDYNGQIVSNAWCKMYEIFNWMITNNYIETDGKNLNTFHIAEAPGAFIAAINHYLSVNQLPISKLNETPIIGAFGNSNLNREIARLPSVEEKPDITGLIYDSIDPNEQDGSFVDEQDGSFVDEDNDLKKALIRKNELKQKKVADLKEIIKKINPKFKVTGKKKDELISEILKNEMQKDPNGTLINVTNSNINLNGSAELNLKNLKWQWFASSYLPIYNKKNNYLGDTYGIMKKYSDQWYFGIDGDGDITSSANIKSFNNEIHQTFKKLNLITSDVKFVPTDTEDFYENEELYNVTVNIGHTLSSIICLDDGGCMILKNFSYFESMSINLIYLVQKCFKQLYIVKPISSRPGNSETYLVGINYQSKAFNELEKDQLLETLEFIRKFDLHSITYTHNLQTIFGKQSSGLPSNSSLFSIFRKEDLDKEFLDRMIEFNNIIINQQIEAMDRYMELVYKYKKITNLRVIQDELNMENDNKKLLNKWIKDNNLKKIKSEDLL